MTTAFDSVPFQALFLEPLRNGIYKKKEFHGRGAPVVNMGELFEYDYLDGQEMKRVELTGRELDACTLRPGDLLFARRSLVLEGSGKCLLVRSVAEPTTFESSIIRARLQLEEVDPRFYYYFFKSPRGRAAMASISTRTAVSGITGTSLAALEVPKPSLAFQRAVVGVLATYDDLIENNTKRIKILEEMARSLYREWFVLLRYPGHEKTPLIDSPLGKVPQSWRVGPLEDVVSLQRGFDITKTQQREGAYSVISSSGPGSKHDEYKVPGPGVIIGRKGTLGTVFFSEGPYWPHDTTLWVTDFHGHSPWYCFQLLRALRLEQYDCGASNPTINRNHIHKIFVAIPPHTLTVEYDRRVAEFMRLSRLLQDESAILRRTRDLLLPRLLSGEIELHP